MLILYVHGKPDGKQRPRTGSAGHFYSPEDTNGFAERVQVTARAEHAQMIEGPVKVGVSVDRRMPKSWSLAKQKRMDQAPATGKPDLDNVLKSLMDALTGITWKDDAQIVQLEIDRSWAYEDAVIINIMPVKEA